MTAAAGRRDRQQPGPGMAGWGRRLSRPCPASSLSMSARSRRKGARGELELARLLSAEGFPATRGAQLYARKAKLGLEAQNHAAEIKLRFERKAGELLRELERGKPYPGSTVSNAGHGSPYRSALDQAGASRQEANRWQRVASVAEAVP